MNDYFDYLAERSPGTHVLKDFRGFALYSYIEDAVYIEDIYVKPKYRKQNEASKLSEEIQKIAKDSGMTRMLGSVSPSAVGSTSSIAVLLAHGMTLLSSQDDLIWFVKNL